MLSALFMVLVPLLGDTTEPRSVKCTSIYFTANMRCSQDITLSRYSGTVSMTNSGRTCLRWADLDRSSFPLVPTFEDADFPIDGSIKQARNYCRNVNESALPWCFVADVWMTFDYCHYRICEVDGPQCGGILTISPGWFASPNINQDGQYENYHNCLWLLDAPIDHQIEIDVQTMNEPKSDYCTDFLEIYESNYHRLYSHATMCGNDTHHIRSGSDDLYLLFVTSDSKQGLKFNGSYSFIPVDMVCPDNVDLTAYSGTVAMTNGGRTCNIWADYGQNYTDADSPKDGRITAAKNFCRSVGERRLPWCHVTDHVIDWEYCYRRICSVEGPPCGGIVNVSSGWVESPDRNLDGLYENNQDCLWTMTAPDGYIIEVAIQFMHTEFDSETGKCYDFVQIYELNSNGSKISETVCGSDLTTFRSNSSIVYIWFKTDESEQRYGFKLSYKHISASHLPVSTIPRHESIPPILRATNQSSSSRSFRIAPAIKTLNQNDVMEINNLLLSVLFNFVIYVFSSYL